MCFTTYFQIHCGLPVVFPFCSLRDDAFVKGEEMGIKKEATDLTQA